MCKLCRFYDGRGDETNATTVIYHCMRRLWSKYMLAIMKWNVIANTIILWWWQKCCAEKGHAPSDCKSQADCFLEEFVYCNSLEWQKYHTSSNWNISSWSWSSRATTKLCLSCAEEVSLSWLCLATCAVRGMVVPNWRVNSGREGWALSSLIIGWALLSVCSLFCTL